MSKQTPTLAINRTLRIKPRKAGYLERLNVRFSESATTA